jgi:hypothetical protein
MAHFYWFHKYTELIPLFVKFVFGSVVNWLEKAINKIVIRFNYIVLFIDY